MNSTAPKPLDLDAGFAALKSFVIEATGLVYFRDKDADLAQRAGRRCHELGINDAAAYLERLRSGPDGAAEFDRLVLELTIGETYFFRHEDQFADLRTTIIPELIERNRATKRLRIWCAGCSIGAEPYSLSILLNESFGSQLAGWDVRIVATDINRLYLDKARRGLFDEWAFRTTDAEFRRRHFTPSDKAWEIKPIYRRWLDFTYHNLMTSPWGALGLNVGEVDLITCRNVMIYFDVPTIERVTPSFEQALGDGGWLVIGHAELAYGATRLEVVQMPRVTAYRKTVTPALAFAPPLAGARPVTTTPPIAAAPPVPVRASAPNPPPPSTAIDATVYLRTLTNGGEFTHALTYATELIARDPRNAAAHYYRALVQEQLGRAREVENDLSRAIDLDPRFVMAQYYAGLFFARRGQKDASVRHFRAVDRLLSTLDDDAMVPEADDLTAQDLRNIVTQRLGAA